MRKTIKSLEQEIRIIKDERDAWRLKFYNEHALRIALKRWIQIKFDWWVDLAVDNQAPCLKYLIKDTAIVLGMRRE